jgi:hypothetical protein
MSSSISVMVDHQTAQGTPGDPPSLNPADPAAPLPGISGFASQPGRGRPAHLASPGNRDPDLLAREVKIKKSSR